MIEPRFTAIDFETYLIEPGILAPKPVCLAVAEMFPGDDIYTGNEMLPQLLRLLKSPDILIGANLAYDVGVSMRHFPQTIEPWLQKYERGEVWDVLIAEQLRDIAKGTAIDKDNPYFLNGARKNRYSLEVCVHKVLGRDNAKENDDWRLRYGELDGVPFSQWPEVARQYPLDDVRNTLDVAESQKSDYLFEQLPHQMRAALALHLSSIHGMRTDREAVRELTERIAQVLKARAEEYFKLGLVDADGSKNSKVIKKLVILATGGSEDRKCEACAGTGQAKGKGKKPIQCKACSATGLQYGPLTPQTDSGGVCADRDTLATCGDELLAHFADGSEVEKIQTTYIPFVQQGVDRPINVRANVLVNTGRTSYEGLIQLLPRKHGVRDVFTPRPGYLYCSVDYAALELCTLAQVIDWTLPADVARVLKNIINESKDPGALHTAFGAKLAGVDPVEFTRLVKSGDKRAKELRQQAKAANFGFPGFMGAQKLVLAQRNVGFFFCRSAGLNERCHRMIVEYKGRSIDPTCADCIEVAEKLRKEWLATFTDANAYLNHVVLGKEGVRENAAVWVSPGTGYIRGGLGVSDAANHPFQHLAAHGAKQALWDVTNQMYSDRTSPLFGSRISLFAHDEIVAEVPESQATEAAVCLAQTMISSMRKWVPDVHIAAEPALMRRWRKEAEPVWLDGKLIPWEDRPRGSK